MNTHARQTAATTSLAALLMLLYGWYGGGPHGVSSSELYNAAVDAFRWTLRIGGVAMLLTSAVCFLGRSVGLLLDFLVTGLCGAVMTGVGAVGLLAGGAPGLQDMLVLVFGLVFLRAAWSSWVFYNEAAPVAAPGAGAGRPAAVEPGHPASVHPSSLPNEGQPAPPQGYLAALADEKDEPPTASYE
jgi:hypothetical protein